MALQFASTAPHTIMQNLPQIKFSTFQVQGCMSVNEKMQNCFCVHALVSVLVYVVTSKLYGFVDWLHNILFKILSFIYLGGGGAGGFTVFLIYSITVYIQQGIQFTQSSYTTLGIKGFISNTNLWGVDCFFSFRMWFSQMLWCGSLLPSYRFIFSHPFTVS